MAGVEELQRPGYSNHFFAFHLMRLFNTRHILSTRGEAKIGRLRIRRGLSFASLSPFTRGEDEGEGLDVSRMLVTRHSSLTTSHCSFSPMTQRTGCLRCP
jgi:hypothetical protein